MSGNTFFFIELVGFHGVVLGWAVWELTSLRREQRRDKAAAASSDRARHAEGQHSSHQG